MKRYTVSSLIGVGSFGRVYKAIHKSDEKVVAIKIISKRGRTNKELKNLRREIDILSRLRHPNIIAFLEFFDLKNDLIVVTEFAYTDLHRYLYLYGALDEKRSQVLICHLVSALYYLHSNRILHRDLKPQNVLLSEDMHAKLCDFGLARNMTMGTHVLTSIKGTPLYMAPELLAERPYDHQADMWSLGCISYESLYGQAPFYTTSILHLVKLLKYEEVKWPSFLSSDCRSFLQGLLEKDPTMRITWAQILCHPFVEGKLLISNIKTDNSPFINPEICSTSKSEHKKKTTNEVSMDLINQLETLELDGTSPTNADNLTSSRDSINAIPPSDIEQLETDVEDLNQVVVPFAECSFKSVNRQQLNLQKITNNAEVPVVNSQTCFVSGNTNLILNHLNDNFPTVATTASNNEVVTKIKPQLSVRKLRSKDLEKRKLSQNLDNFSLRLGQSSELENANTQQRKEREKDHVDNRTQGSTLKNFNQSGEEKRSTENSPPCLLPGWDSCDESQNPPIENDEWLAFLQRTTQEILDGELDSLKQQNLVCIIVAPLRNSKAIPKVVESVAQLLALPFVLNEPSGCIIELIKTVYVDVKLVPNLMYASKLLVYQKSTNESSASITMQTRSLRVVADLTVEEIRALARLYELICHLVHLRQQFLSQFCDAVAILAANDLLINLLTHDFKNSHATRISNCIIALFCCVLRELPENAELVEKIIFNSKLQLSRLLENNCDLLRLRMCMLFRLLTRFSLRGLQTIWSTKLKHIFESLAEDSNEEVKEEAERTLEDLRQFAFYT